MPDAALDMIHRQPPGSTRRLSPGADKGFDSAGVVADLRRSHVTPHVARRARHSAIDRRTTRHPGYALSQKQRKNIDVRRDNDPRGRCLIRLPFGRAKSAGGAA